MKTDIAKLLQKKHKEILSNWMNIQIAESALREDLMSNEQLREQSIELLDVLLKTISDKNISDTHSSEFEPVLEILSGISISRARQGFSPRETGAFVFSLKE